MNLLIVIKHPKVTLELRNKKNLTDKEAWVDENDMSTKLLGAIDNILTRNKLKIENIVGIEVESDQRSYTSTRIAKTVAKTVGYCLVA